MAQETIEKLLQLARLASAHAYAPYSGFAVGAAILSVNGQMYAGCNVENASYGLACCAERNAIFQMVADGQREIACVAIYTPTAAPTAPCGACRQVIGEFGAGARVVSSCQGPERLDTTLEALLPNAFGPHSLT